MTTDACPDGDTLELLLLGKLPAAQRERLDEHLLHCERCAAGAEVVVASDELTAALGSPRAYCGDEAVLARAIGRSKKLREEVDTVQSEETLVVGRPMENAADAPLRHDEEIDFLSPAEQPDEIGRLGGYRVLEVLGVGGMGVVFRAEDPKLKRQVALKAMKPAMAASRAAKQRFLREAQSTASIEHDNIVNIYQVGEDRHIPFIAMQFLRGESLQSRLGREQQLDQREVLRIGREVAAGLEAAHQRDLLHRDIKPDNIWIEEGTGRVKILDFGLVRTASSDAGLTQSGMVVGTPRYMSPEQAQGGQVDYRCDLFSLGAVLYHLASGKAPFDGVDVTALLDAVTHADCRPVDEVCPDVRPELAALIMQLLQKDRERRPQSAAAIVRAVERIEQQWDEQVGPDQLVETAEWGDAAESLSAGEASPAPAARSTAAAMSLPRRLSRSPRVLVATAAAALLLLAAIVFFVQTRDGVIRVEINDPDIKVTIKGTQIVLKQADGGKDVKLSPGDHTLIVERGDFKFETDKLILKKNETVTVRVELLAGHIHVRQGEKLIGQKKLPAPPLAVAPFDVATAKKHQQAWADYLGVPVEKEVDLGGGEKLTMVLIPPGEFTMGSTAVQRDEGPQHLVRITKPFALSRYEVTRGQFRRFVQETKYKTDAERDGKGGEGYLDGKRVRRPQFLWRASPGFSQTDDHPVLNISWNDAKAFCEWMSSKHSGVKFALPTEAQWEHACRAGTTTKWHFDDSRTSLKEHGWSDVNSDGRTHPVGQLRPSGFGLYDMYGNVWEWCADWYVPDYYARSPRDDPSGGPTGLQKVTRGGSWTSFSGSCRSGRRGRDKPDYGQILAGFRLAMTFDAATKQTDTKSPAAPESTRYLWPADAPPPAIAPFDATTAKKHQQAWADHLGLPVEKEVDVGGGAKITFMLIPPGEFMMGSSAEEQASFLAETRAAGDGKRIGLLLSERPKHRVRVTRPFYLGKHELTQAQWKTVMGSNPSAFPAAMNPVEQVRWNETTPLLIRLNQASPQKGMSFVLPTEAQWRYACRAGTTTSWHFGDREDELKQHAWFAANSDAKTHPVGELKPNAWGLYDMHGNVCEWCADWYGADYYAQASPNDPMGPISGRHRVLCGGDWDLSARYCRSAFRKSGTVVYRSSYRGVRLAMTIGQIK